MTEKQLNAWCLLVLAWGVALVGIALFFPGFSFGQRTSVMTAAMVDFGAVAFSKLWRKLHSVKSK